jgi:hypothetical protein
MTRSHGFVERTVRSGHDQSPGELSMKHLSMICRAAPLALLLIAACAPALQPVAAPAPVSAPAALTAEDEAMLDALLKVHFGDRPVDPAARETFRRLMAVAIATPAPPTGTSTPPRPSPEVERALRELQASAGTVEDMQRILRQYVAETQESRQP